MEDGSSNKNNSGNLVNGHGKNNPVLQDGNKLNLTDETCSPPLISPSNPWGKPKAWGCGTLQPGGQLPGRNEVQDPALTSEVQKLQISTPSPAVQQPATKMVWGKLQPVAPPPVAATPVQNPCTPALPFVRMAPGGNWKPLPEGKDDIQLPQRTAAAKEFTKNQITIAVNHFPLHITLPEIFMYHVQGLRRHTSEKFGVERKKKGTEPADNEDVGIEAAAAPAFPKRVLQKILKCLRISMTREFEQKTKQKIGIATDFMSNFYTTKRLKPIGLVHSIDMGNLAQLRIEDPDPAEIEKSVFTITFMPTVWEVDIPRLAEHINNSVGFRNPHLAVELPTVYNAVIKAMPNYKYLAMGRSLLIRFPPEGQDGHRLGGGLSSWAGISACVNPGWKFFLNIELCYSTMRVGDNVIAALTDYFGTDASNVLQWTPDDIEKGSSYLKSAKVEYSPQKGMTRGGTVSRIDYLTPRQATFGKDGQDITIEQYYKQQYNLTLKYPNGPLLIFSGKGVKVPGELCKVRCGQSVNRKLTDQQTRSMVAVARKYPNELETEILRATKELNLNRNETFGNFGIRVDEKMLEMQCRVIDPPVISYGKAGGNGFTDVNPDKGAWSVWNQANFRFKRPVNELRTRQWGILVFGREDRNAVRNFTDSMVQQGKKGGLTFSINPFVVYKQMQERLTGDIRRDRAQHNDNVSELVGIFKRLQREGCQVVVVVIPYKPCRFYGQVKQAAELSCHGVGIMTQCLLQHTFSPKPPKVMNSASATVQQILLKINSKLDGISHSINLPLHLKAKFGRIDFPNLQEAVLVIGADVTHPPQGTAMKDPKDPKKEIPIPSFASVTASVDRTCMPYMMNVQAQKRAGKGAAEVIKNLGEIVGEFIKEFFRRNRTLPGKIIYYRDGVGEGQFKEILHVEMRGMRNGLQQFDKANRGVPYQPKITFICVQKRHKTRFFLHPGKNRKTENAPPGTVVDCQIVHSTEMDFYLLSHAAVQGTTRPTRYHVLWDDSGFTTDELQIMTYYLCYNYARCNHSVRIPAPTYYAHWAAARAKALADGNEHLYSEDLVALNEKLRRVGQFTQTFPMHFI